MSLKKFDLAKNLGLKIEAQRRAAGTPGRFGDAAAALPDKREQRRRDAAAGLVPFACKLPATLVDRLRERAGDHPDGMNGLVSELLTQSLGEC